MMSRFVLFLFLLYFAFASSAQSPYELSWEKDAALLGIGLGGSIGGLLLENSLDPLSDEAILALDPNDVNSFDRKTIDNYTTNADLASDIFKYSAWTYPIVLLAGKKVRKDYIAVGVMAAEALMINVALTSLTKGIAKRPRPFVYNPDVPFEKKTRVTSRFSFFSGHTSGVSVLSFYSAKVFADYHPDNNWKYVVWSSAALVSVSTGYLRVRAGRHFRTDVIAGVGVGALVGILIPHLHKKKDKDQKVSFQLLPVGNGMGVTMRW